MGYQHDSNKENPNNDQVPVFDSLEWREAVRTADAHRAIHLYDQILEGYGGDVDVLFPILNNRAIRYEELGEYEKALDAFSKALNLVSTESGQHKFIRKNIDICVALREGQLLKREKAVFSGPYI